MWHYIVHKIQIAVYYAFFSHILYGMLIGWGSATQTRKKPLQILKNKVLRIINKSLWKDEITTKLIFLKYNLFKINDIHKYELG